MAYSSAVNGATRMCTRDQGFAADVTVQLQQRVQIGAPVGKGVRRTNLPVFGELGTDDGDVLASRVLEHRAVERQPGGLRLDGRRSGEREKPFEQLLAVRVLRLCQLADPRSR